MENFPDHQEETVRRRISSTQSALLWEHVDNMQQQRCTTWMTFIMWAYGVNNFCKDIDAMLDFTPSIYFRVT